MGIYRFSETIRRGYRRRYPGNYTNFIARKKENYDKQMKDHIAQQKEIERTRKRKKQRKNPEPFRI